MECRAPRAAGRRPPPRIGRLLAVSSARRQAAGQPIQFQENRTGRSQAGKKMKNRWRIGGALPRSWLAVRRRPAGPRGGQGCRADGPGAGRRPTRMSMSARGVQAAAQVNGTVGPRRIREKRRTRCGEERRWVTRGGTARPVHRHTRAHAKVPYSSTTHPRRLELCCLQ